MVQNDKPQDEVTGVTRDLHEFDFEDILPDDLPAVETASEPAMNEAELIKTQNISLITEEIQREQEQAQKKPEKKEKKEKKEQKRSKDQAALSEEEYRISKRRKGRYIRGRIWKTLAGILTWAKDIAIAILVLWAIQMFIAGYIKNDNTAMDPTIKSGETVLYSRFSYRFSDPGRGEIIAFKIGNNDRAHISRIIGLPGDVVTISQEGAITVNDKAFVTPYSDGTTMFIPGQVTYPYTVPEGSYFVLCDNPNATMDSRFISVGAVPKENIVGKVFFCVWPRTSWRPIVQGLISTDKP